MQRSLSQLLCKIRSLLLGKVYLLPIFSQTFFEYSVEIEPSSDHLRNPMEPRYGFETGSKRYDPVRYTISQLFGHRDDTSRVIQAVKSVPSVLVDYYHFETTNSSAIGYVNCPMIV